MLSTFLGTTSTVTQTKAKLVLGVADEGGEKEEEKKTGSGWWMAVLSTVLSVVCCGHRGAPRAPL